jgi:hypothetical protein
MKYALVTLYNTIVQDLVKPLTENKQEYCNRWGYSYFLNIVNYTERDWEIQHYNAYGFARIKYLLDLMTQYPNIDCFCWMDNDAFIMNQTIDLDTLLKSIPEFDLLIGEDWNGINSGVFFLKNNNQTQIFLEKMYSFTPNPYDGRPYWWVRSEQCAFTDLISTINTYIVHHSLFNGYIILPKPDNDWRFRGLQPFHPYWQPQQFQLGDFVLHFVGTPNEQKKQLIQEYLNQVIK